MTTTTSQTLHSICDYSGCQQTITITITDGQKWQDVDWQHVDPNPTFSEQHRAIPELRFAIDATCPGCKYPEIGFAPAREEFICARCQHSQTTRPKD